MPKVGLLLAIAGLLLTSAISGASAATATSLDDAKKLSAESGLPVLLKVGTSWCGYCKAFDKASTTDENLRTALADNVILCPVDAEKGEGVDIARMYSVNDYPTFVLTNDAGEMMDRWTGYHKPDKFVQHLTAAVENPITVKERLARFQEHPTEIDARKIGELRDYGGYFAEAIAYYNRAQALNPASDTNYDLLVLNAMARGTEGNLFGVDQVRDQADGIVASDTRTSAHLLKVAYTMGKLAQMAGDRSHFLPYLKAAVEGTEGDEGESVMKGRSKLLPEYALHIEKSTKKAVSLKKEAFALATAPENWMENANLLNNFAWWCFENSINLDEAEEFARKGIERAEAGNMKANILDTLAEICNLKGDCGDAVKYIELAVAEDPENEYFQKQLVRFQELLAAQTK
jgi:thioredoxin-related protein